jgi:hypothetical protein
VTFAVPGAQCWSNLKARALRTAAGGIQLGPGAQDERAKSALLGPLRSRTTCKNAGLHSGEPSIADKSAMAGGRHEGGESGLPGQARLSLVRESPLIRLMRGPSRHHELLL